MISITFEIIEILVNHDGNKISRLQKIFDCQFCQKFHGNKSTATQRNLFDPTMFTSHCLARSDVYFVKCSETSDKTKFVTFLEFIIRPYWLYESATTYVYMYVHVRVNMVRMWLNSIGGSVIAHCSNPQTQEKKKYTHVRSLTKTGRLLHVFYARSKFISRKILLAYRILGIAVKIFKDCLKIKLHKYMYGVHTGTCTCVQCTCMYNVHVHVQCIGTCKTSAHVHRCINIVALWSHRWQRPYIHVHVHGTDMSGHTETNPVGAEPFTVYFGVRNTHVNIISGKVCEFNSKKG